METWEHVAFRLWLHLIAPAMADDSGRGAMVYDGELDRIEYPG